MRAYGRTKTRRDVRKPDRNRIRTAIMKKHCAVKRRATISPRCRLLGEAPLGLATLWHCNDSGEPPAREVNAKKKPSLAEGRRRSVQRSTQTSEAACCARAHHHSGAMASRSNSLGCVFRATLKRRLSDAPVAPERRPSGTSKKGRKGWHLKRAFKQQARLSTPLLAAASVVLSSLVDAARPSKATPGV